MSPMSDMGAVVLSSDIHPNYAFYAPLTSAIWRSRGYRPLLFLVGTAEQWLADPRLRLSLQHSREIGAEIYFIPEPTSPHLRRSTVAQMVRFFASTLPHISDASRLVTADVDMWPLGQWIDESIDPSKDMTLLYSNAYKDSAYPHWPVCYMSATAKTWSEIIGCEQGNLNPGLATALVEAPSDEQGAWNWDEKWIGARIAAWSGYPDRVKQVERTFCKGEWRLDRSGWDEGWAHLQGSLDGVADAHLPRPGFDENWNRIRPLWEMIMPPELIRWADEYRAAWIGLDKRPLNG